MLISNKLILEEFVRKHSRAVKPINKWVTDYTIKNYGNHEHQLYHNTSAV